MFQCQQAQARALVDEAERLHRLGLTNRQIAFRMGVSERSSELFQCQQAQARALVDEAERLHRLGLTNRQIAFRMGVSERNVKDLRGGKS